MDLISRIKASGLTGDISLKNGGPDTRLTLNGHSYEKQEAVVSLLDGFLHDHLKIKELVFRFKDSQGREVEYKLDLPDLKYAVASKNGTISLHINREEALSFMATTGQSSNKGHKVATMAFDPQKISDSNLMIFRVEDLKDCLLENEK